MGIWQELDQLPTVKKKKKDKKEKWIDALQDKDFYFKRIREASPGGN